MGQSNVIQFRPRPKPADRLSERDRAILMSLNNTPLPVDPVERETEMDMRAIIYADLCRRNIFSPGGAA
jgi:hypothetical protein